MQKGKLTMTLKYSVCEKGIFIDWGHPAAKKTYEALKKAEEKNGTWMHGSMKFCDIDDMFAYKRSCRREYLGVEVCTTELSPGKHILSCEHTQFLTNYINPDNRPENSPEECFNKLEKRLPSQVGIK